MFVNVSLLSRELLVLLDLGRAATIIKLTFLAPVGMQAAALFGWFEAPETAGCDVTPRVAILDEPLGRNLVGLLRETDKWVRRGTLLGIILKL